MSGVYCCGNLTPLLTVITTEISLPEGQITIGQHLSSCRVALRPAVLSAARIWPSVSQYLEISFGLREPFPHVFTPFGVGGVRGVHPLAAEAPLIRGMPTGPSAFLEMPGAFGLRPCARTHQKRPCVTHTCWSSNTANHYWCYPNSTRLLTFSM